MLLQHGLHLVVVGDPRLVLPPLFGHLGEGTVHPRHRVVELSPRERTEVPLDPVRPHSQVVQVAHVLIQEGVESSDELNVKGQVVLLYQYVE